MTFRDFIFTKEKPQKYLRHLAFWVAQILFWRIWATVFFNSFGSFWHYLVSQGFYIFLNISYTYAVVYFFFPKYFSPNRLEFGLRMLILSLFTYLLGESYFFYEISTVKFTLVKLSRDTVLLNIWYGAMNFITSGPPIICAMFLTFKMLKNYYIKMEEKQILTKENAKAELQLLKAQIHPHFLFNTLNNIYSFTLNNSPKAGNLVLKLSDTMRYMINDCEAELVPLEEELKMLADYIGLEKVRYGDRLDMQVEINGDYKNKMIVPLLMIPFVENSFKHGVSKMRGKQWIKLTVSIQDNLLSFNLRNSKPSKPIDADNKKGIGLANVQKRLQLLYPGKHLLEIKSNENSYEANLQIRLQREAAFEKISSDRLLKDSVYA